MEATIRELKAPTLFAKESRYSHQPNMVWFPPQMILPETLYHKVNIEVSIICCI